MSAPVLQTLDLVRTQILELETKLSDKKKLANSLCELAGIPSEFNIELPQSTISFSGRGDEYYGKPISSAIKEILEHRKASNLGPATVAELFEQLVSGGFKFETASDENSKKSLRICLTKNSAMFHKLPNGKYGLLKWYPKAKQPKTSVAPKSLDVALDLEGDDLMKEAANFHSNFNCSPNPASRNLVDELDEEFANL